MTELEKKMYASIATVEDNGAIDSTKYFEDMSRAAAKVAEEYGRQCAHRALDMAAEEATAKMSYGDTIALPRVYKESILKLKERF